MTLAQNMVEQDPSGRAARASASPNEAPSRRPMGRVVTAATLGTLIEWYDFYLYGSLAIFFSTLFFPPQAAFTNILLSVGTFATGFAARPIGGLLFGAMGDRVGRKYTFLVTMLLIGGSTLAIGIMPTYGQIGIASSIILLVIRLVQGLALGGEYGGAATYVAEFAPARHRGFFTSWIQTTAAIAMVLATGVIALTEWALGLVAFRAWGWRLPFILSVGLVVISVWTRLKMEESPVFAEMKKKGALDPHPVRSSLTNRSNLRALLVALFGVTAGQAAMGSTGLLYALYFLQAVLKIDSTTASTVVAVGLCAGAPFFVLFGWLSDRIGRRPLVLTGFTLGLVLDIPIYMAMHASAAVPAVLALLVALQIILLAMVYGPMAALLAEMFPTQLRYTSLSIPFNLANGLIGGFLPLIALSLVAVTGNIYAGLYFPMGILVISITVNLLFVRETRDCPLAA